MNKYERMLMAQRGYMEENKGDGGDGGSGDAAAAAKAAEDAATAAAAAKAAEDAAATLTDAEKVTALQTKLDAAEAEKKALLHETMGRKEKNKELEAAQTAAAKELERLKAIETEQLKKESEAELKKLEDAKDHEAVKAHLIKQHATELETQKESLEKEYKDKIDTLQASVDAITSQTSKLAVDNVLAEADLPDYVFPKSAREGLFAGHIEYKDGRAVIYDKPVTAKDKVEITDGQGNPKAAKEAFLDLIKAHPDHDFYKRANIKTGSGSTTDSSLKPAEQKPAKTGIELMSSSLQAHLKKQAGG